MGPYEPDLTRAMGDLKMTKIKTRIKARKASIDKWIEIQEKVLEVRNLIDVNCGFCLLASTKTDRVYQCKCCEPDAEKLCREYITDGTEKSIIKVLEKAMDLVVELKDNIVNLPDVYKEE